MKQIISAIFSIFLSYTALAQFHYPATRTVDSSDIYFGVTYKDAYRWIEDIQKPEVEKWFKNQASFSDSVLANLDGKDSLIAEWKRLDRMKSSRHAIFGAAGGKIFYRKTNPGETVGKLYYRQGTMGKEILLFDPANYIKGKVLSMGYATPSYNGKLVAIDYSEQGAEVATIKVMDVEKREFLKDSLYPTSGIGSWTFDNKSFIYTWIRSDNSKDPTAWLNSKSRLHKIGTLMREDRDFFSNGSYPDLKMDSSIYPYAYVVEDSRDYIFAGEGSVQSEAKMYYAPASTFHNQKIPWKILATPADKIVRSIIAKNDNLFAITYNNAKNYKVISTSLKKPDWNNPVIIAEEKSDKTVQYLSYSKDFLFIVYSDGINSSVSKYNFKTKALSEIKTPFQGTINLLSYDTKSNNCLVGITSWAQPYTEFAYDPVTESFLPSQFNKPIVFPAAYKDLVVEEVEVKGHDGVMVPLSIIYKKGLKLDGTNVCLMESYGAYGSSMVPNFSPMKTALAIRNVILAIPHVRGGSEKGEAWYRAGFKNTKPNTWKDFISCAEYLIEKGYTSPAKLAGTGTSAGGILITRSITERPDLFAAAVCNVGCANALRLEFSANGPVNIPEFGTVKDSLECRALYEMDGMQHVVSGTKYPAVLSVGGWNDPRVVAWQPGKFAASMQNASTSGRPVLLKINYDNGHFTEDKNVTFSNFGDQYSFALWQCGHPDFQPKNPGTPATTSVRR